MNDEINVTPAQTLEEVQAKFLDLKPDENHIERGVRQRQDRLEKTLQAIHPNQPEPDDLFGFQATTGQDLLRRHVTGAEKKIREYDEDIRQLEKTLERKRRERESYVGQRDLWALDLDLLVRLEETREA